jgi:hypothetical protein
MSRVSAPASEAVSTKGILQEAAPTEKAAFEQVAAAQDSANHQRGLGWFQREAFRFQAPSAHCRRMIARHCFR